MVVAALIGTGIHRVFAPQVHIVSPVNNASFLEGQSITFTAETLSGNGLTYEWDFDGVDFAYGPRVSFTFTTDTIGAASCYPDVSLTATDPFGEEDLEDVQLVLTGPDCSAGTGLRTIPQTPTANRPANIGPRAVLSLRTAASQAGDAPFLIPPDQLSGTAARQRNSDTSQPSDTVAAPVVQTSLTRDRIVTGSASLVKET